MPVGPVINPAGLARIARYVGEAMVFESWEAVAEALCRMQGTQFPKADAAFWLRMARRAAREKDGRIVLDYGSGHRKGSTALWHRGAGSPAAVPFVDAKPHLGRPWSPERYPSRGGCCGHAGDEARSRLRASFRCGHAPTLEEPSAGEALANFLRRIS